MVRDAIKRYVEAAQSLTEVPRERAEQIARTLAGSGLIDTGQIRGVASDIVGRSRENRRKLTDLVAREIRKQVLRIGFASKDEVERLRQRIQALEISERRIRQASERTQAKRKPATKPAGKASTGRKPTTARR
jgi:polyhydroxyalkanoate synthesis regulator phasin